MHLSLYCLFRRKYSAVHKTPTHKLEEIFEITDRVAVLKDGKTAAEHKTDGVPENGLIEEMVGRKIENEYFRVIFV